MAEVSEQRSSATSANTDPAENLSNKSGGTDRVDLVYEDGEFRGKGGGSIEEGSFEPEEGGAEKGEVLKGEPQGNGSGGDVFVGSLPTDVDINAEEWQRIKEITSYALEMGSEEEADGVIFHQPGEDAIPKPHQLASTAASSTQEPRFVPGNCLVKLHNVFALMYSTLCIPIAALGHCKAQCFTAYLCGCITG